MNVRLDRLFLAIARAALALAPAAAQSPTPSPAPSPAENIQVLYDQKVPMRDGIRLSANIFVPRELKSPLPAILVLTPYNNDHNTPRGIYFSTHGYVFVTVDCRGRGNSDGVFTPFVNEGRDGYDVVEWIARQPWCNGKVGTMGGSYKGMDQWLIAKEHPPHLASMSPTATVAPGIDATWDRNIFRTYNLNILSYVFGRTQNRENFFSDYNTARVQQAYREHRPYAELIDALASPPENHMQQVYRTWTAHPTLDRYWLDMLPTADDFARLQIPILIITGYFDDDQPGTMHYYDGFQRAASDEQKSRIYFIAGPWDHGGTRRPSATLGGLDFGKESVLDIFGLHKAWFDWTLKGGPKPDLLKDHVVYFSMGASTWKSAPTLAALSNDVVSYYLDADGRNPSDPFQSGRLGSAPAAGEAAATIVYDPLQNANKDKGVGASGRELTSQAYLNEPGWLYFHTAPLAAPVEISGFPVLDAFIRIDAPDTDFYYRLYEVKPDGTNLFLARGLMRARFRNSLTKEELVTPGAVTEYRIQALNFFNRTIPAGSRLRLMFGPLDSSEYQKNYNTGGDVSKESGKDARTVKIELLGGSRYPTRLELPVLRPR
jgi:uncharacterized protein